MSDNSTRPMSRRTALKAMGALGASSLAMPSASAQPSSEAVVGVTSKYHIADLNLEYPVARSNIITKVMGSVGQEDTHAFMRFHIYGFLGDGNLIPLFSMNNYLVQRWQPIAPGITEMQHYEVGYYCEFDTDTPLTHWKNPVTGAQTELFHFVLGPITRRYTPEGIIAPGLAPNPMRVNVIGNRVFVPAQSIESLPNAFSPEEWPDISSGPTIFWDSLFTFSANIDDVLNPHLSNAPAEIHLQNMASWQPYLGFGNQPGRTMVRAWGGNISGYDALEPKVRKGFETYTPEIFDIDNWHQVRFDFMEYYNKMKAQRDVAKGAK